MIENIVVATIGGLIYCVFPYVEGKRKPKESQPIQNKSFWLLFFFWPFVGGFLAYVFSETLHNKGMAFYLGMSAPSLIRQAIQTKLPQTVRLADEDQ